jgi:hypothetical protein
MGNAMWSRATSGCAAGRSAGATIAVGLLFFFPPVLYSRCCLSEYLAQLQQPCDGGECYYIHCVCRVHHWEYFTLSSVGGFAQLCALMTGVLFSMNDLLNIIFYPPSPDTANIYTPIIQS